MKENGKELKDTIVWELPICIGAVVYEKCFPILPKQVIGYRIGRMTGEDEDEFEENYGGDEPYIIYEGCGMSGASPVSELGKSIFLTREEAVQAASGLQK